MQRRRVFKKNMWRILLVLVFLSGCATTPPVQLTEGMPNTITYKDYGGVTETVYNLDGNWIETSGKYIITINQNNNNVEGYWKQDKGFYSCKDGTLVFNGTLVFKGKTKADKIKGARYLCEPVGQPTSLSVKIMENGNQLRVGTFSDGAPSWAMFKRTQ